MGVIRQVGKVTVITMKNLFLLLAFFLLASPLTSALKQKYEDSDMDGINDATDDDDNDGIPDDEDSDDDGDGTPDEFEDQDGDGLVMRMKMMMVMARTIFKL